MLNSIRDCFVTGKWDENQDAATLLKEDGKRPSKHTDFNFRCQTILMTKIIEVSVEPSVTHLRQ